MTVAADPAPASTEIHAAHTRLLKCTLAVEESRVFWRRVQPERALAASDRAFQDEAFAQLWFGSRSLRRVEVLAATMRHRFVAFPAALGVLHRWRDMPPDTRALICHWHLQLADPTYRAFTGDYLVSRHDAGRPVVDRRGVAAWLGLGAATWSLATRVELASKLLSCGFAAGLITSRRDPRPLAFPRVPDAALGYLLHLLREVRFAGTLLDNPYLRSLGLAGPVLEARLRALPSLSFRRAADVVEFGWRYPTLTAWAQAEVLPADAAEDVGR